MAVKRDSIEEMWAKPALSQSDAAYLLQSSRQGIHNLLNNGRLRAILVDGRRFIETKSLLEYMLRKKRRFMDRADEMRLPKEFK